MMKKLLMMLVIVAAACGGDGSKPSASDPANGWYGGSLLKQWQWEGEDPLQVEQEIAFFPLTCRGDVCALSSTWGTRHGNGVSFDDTYDGIYFTGVDGDGTVYPFHIWYHAEASGHWDAEMGGEMRLDVTFYNSYGDRIRGYWHTFTFGPQTHYEPPRITGNDAAVTAVGEIVDSICTPEACPTRVFPRGVVFADDAL